MRGQLGQQLVFWDVCSDDLCIVRGLPNLFLLFQRIQTPPQLLIKLLLFFLGLNEGMQTVFEILVIGFFHLELLVAHFNLGQLKRRNVYPLVVQLIVFNILHTFCDLLDVWI